MEIPGLSLTDAFVILNIAITIIVYTIQTRRIKQQEKMLLEQKQFVETAKNLSEIISPEELKQYTELKLEIAQMQHDQLIEVKEKDWGQLIDDLESQLNEQIQQTIEKEKQLKVLRIQLTELKENPKDEEYLKNMKKIYEQQQTLGSLKRELEENEKIFLRAWFGKFIE